MVVGLGNPGAEYAETRHNLGFRVIDALAQKLQIEVKKRKFGARLGTGVFANKKLILLKPWQYMNRSGQAVATAVGFFKLPLSALLVVSDDMDLEPGRIRLRKQGSAGGQKGLADILARLGTEQVCRLRIGIGSAGRVDAVDYVLSRPSPQEKPLLDEAVERAREAVLCWIEHGMDTAMNRFNRPVSEEQ